jgi:hypothetical protein
MKLEIEVEFEIGASVNFNNKMGKDEGVVIGYYITEGSRIRYAVVWSDKKDLYHYGIELKMKL